MTAPSMFILSSNQPLHNMSPTHEKIGEPYRAPCPTSSKVLLTGQKIVRLRSRSLSCVLYRNTLIRGLKSGRFERNGTTEQAKKCNK